MRPYLFIFFIVIAVGLIGYFVFLKNRSPAITNVDSQGSTIVAFGDSITNGFGVGRENAYPAILARELGISVINAGKNGDTTQGALERIEEDVLYHDPWLVIVFLGGNDVLQRIPKEETFSNLSDIINNIQTTGSAVVLVGVRGPGIVTDPYKASFKELSERYKTAYVPDILTSLLGRSELMYDAIHPNRKGHELVAERILEVVRPIIGRR